MIGKTLIVIIGTGELSARLATLLAAEENILLVSMESETQNPRDLLDQITDVRERDTRAEMSVLRSMIERLPLDRPHLYGHNALSRTELLQRQRLHGRRTGRK